MSEGSETVLSIAVGGRPPESSRLPHGDLESLEATRVAAVRRGEVVDTLLAHREAAMLHALEKSLNSGRVAAVRSATTRAALRVLKGGVGRAHPARRPASSRRQLIAPRSEPGLTRIQAPAARV